MQSTGIHIERNAKGIPVLAHIDLSKYGRQLNDFFAANGVAIEEPLYDPEFVAKIRRAEKQPSKKIDLSQYGISI